MTDPNASADGASIYGLGHTTETAGCVVLGVPWDVTASGRRTCAATPRRIVEASRQVDLYDAARPDHYKSGIALDIINTKKQYAKSCRDVDDCRRGVDNAALIRSVNQSCKEIMQVVFKQSAGYLNQGKQLILLGGDHSTALGYIEAVAAQKEDFGILHIDAHADLRTAYEGFQYSHASVMNHALKLQQLSSLVQVGIRDYCHEEAGKIENDARITAYMQRDMDRRLFMGEKWADLCREIIAQLPERVYVSFDIDALSPENCPATGTPVPGGLSYHQAIFLLNELATSNKVIAGMDLVEAGAEPFDLMVAAHLLYRMSVLFGINWAQNHS